MVVVRRAVEAVSARAPLTDAELSETADLIARAHPPGRISVRSRPPNEASQRSSRDLLNARKHRIGIVRRAAGAVSARAPLTDAELSEIADLITRARRR